jgi:hypothetical protein
MTEQVNRQGKDNGSGPFARNIVQRRVRPLSDR